MALFLVANRRYLVGDLVNTVKKLPKDFKDGKKAAEDPVSAAKDVGGVGDVKNADEDR